METVRQASRRDITQTHHSQVPVLVCAQTSLPAESGCYLSNAQRMTHLLLRPAPHSNAGWTWFYFAAGNWMEGTGMDMYGCRYVLIGRYMHV